MTPRWLEPIRLKRFRRGDGARQKRCTVSQASAAVESLPFAPLCAAAASPGQYSSVSGIRADDYFFAAVRRATVRQVRVSPGRRGGLRVTTTFDPTLQAEA